MIYKLPRNRAGQQSLVHIVKRDIPTMEAANNGASVAD